MIAATALLGLTSRASAAEISAIDPASVTITKCTNGDVAECEKTQASDSDMSDLYLWQSVRIDMDWSAPADAKAGDTFSVQLTEPLSAYSGSFHLKDGTGATVGTCAASHDTGLVTCTLSDYVGTHENVAGSLWFSAQATTATESTRNPVTIKGEAVATPVPGVIAVGDPVTQSDSKGGWVSYPRTAGGNASVTWVVLLGSDSVTEENGIDMVDTLGSAQNFDPTCPRST